MTTTRNKQNVITPMAMPRLKLLLKIILVGFMIMFSKEANCKVKGVLIYDENSLGDQFAIAIEYTRLERFPQNLIAHTHEGGKTRLLYRGIKKMIVTPVLDRDFIGKSDFESLKTEKKQLVDAIKRYPKTAKPIKKIIEDLDFFINAEAQGLVYKEKSWISKAVLNEIDKKNREDQVAAQISFTTVSGKEFTSATVKQIMGDSIIVSWKGGVSKVKFEDLPEYLQQRFHNEITQERQTIAAIKKPVTSRILSSRESTTVAAIDSEIWRSKDGRIAKGRGIYSGVKGLTISHKVHGNEVFIPYSALNSEDARRGINTLPFFINDDVRMAVKTSKQTRNVYLEETGSFAISVNLYSYDGYRINGFGTATPIMKKVKESGRIVTATLSSPSGNGFCAVEFFFIAKVDGAKKIVNTQSGVYEFNKFGSSLQFQSPNVEDMMGWVVVARSLNTGEIIQTSSSMHFLEGFVLSQIPEQAKFTNNTKQFKNAILETLN